MIYNYESDIKHFEFNPNTGFYEMTGSGDYVHDLLNEEAVKQHYSRKWTNKLEHESSGVFPSSESDSCPASPSSDSHPLSSAVVYVLSPLAIGLVLFMFFV